MLLLLLLLHIHMCRLLCWLFFVLLCFRQERIKNFQEKRTAAEGSRRAKTAAKRSAQTAIKRENKRKGIKARKKGREGAIAAVAAKGEANGSAEGVQGDEACVAVEARERSRADIKGGRFLLIVRLLPELPRVCQGAHCFSVGAQPPSL